jgi:hypothetical protein
MCPCLWFSVVMRLGTRCWTSKRLTQGLCPRSATKWLPIVLPASSPQLPPFTGKPHLTDGYLQEEGSATCDADENGGDRTSGANNQAGMCWKFTLSLPILSFLPSLETLRHQTGPKPSCHMEKGPGLCA